MKTYKLTIKSLETILHKGIYDFKNRNHAQTYMIGMCEGLRLGGMNPTKMSLKEIKDK